MGDVRSFWNDAGDAEWVGFAWSCRRRVHDLQVTVTQVIARTAEAVNHPGAANQCGVGMGIDVKFDRSVHGDTTETTDRLGGVGDRQRTQNTFVEIFIPVVEETRETRVF